MKLSVCSLQEIPDQNSIPLVVKEIDFIPFSHILKHIISPARRSMELSIMIQSQ